MGRIQKPVTLQNRTVPTAEMFNPNFDVLYNEFNGKIGNDNIDPSAGIAESKLAFNPTSGHKHDGIDSAKIAVNRAFPWFIDGTLNPDPTGRRYARWIVPQAMTIKKAWGAVEAAPTGADILIDIHKNGISIWSTQSNRLTITAGELSGTRTAFDTAVLAPGDMVDIFIDQIGSIIAGSALSVLLECEQ